MKRKPMTVAVIIGVLAALGTLALIIQSAMGSKSHLCNVCITFNGRTKCDEAWGSSRQEAIRTATDTACGPLAGGMTESIRCSNTPPTEVTCEP